MSEKKENREEEKEQSSSRSGSTDEKIEAALNACTFGQTKEVRCKDCPRDSEKEPCITNLHLAALAYIRRLKHRAEEAERKAIVLSKWLADKTRKDYPYQAWLEAAQKQAEKELAEEGKDD